MRKTIKDYALLLFAAAFAAVQGCAGKPEKLPRNTIVSVVADITDTGIVHIEPEDVVNLFRMTRENVLDGLTFRRRLISEAHDREIMQARVEPEAWLLSYPKVRADEVMSFKSGVLEAIAEVKSCACVEKRNSLVAQTASMELNALADIKGTDKCMVLASDLLHHDGNFSFYSEADFSLARRSPDSAAAILERLAPLPDLRGITIYVVYRPPNLEEQRMFDVASRVFTRLYEGRGAKVIVTPNILL